MFIGLNFISAPVSQGCFQFQVLFFQVEIASLLSNGDLSFVSQVVSENTEEYHTQDSNLGSPPLHMPVFPWSAPIALSAPIIFHSTCILLGGKKHVIKEPMFILVHASKQQNCPFVGLF